MCFVAIGHNRGQSTVRLGNLHVYSVRMKLVQSEIQISTSGIHETRDSSRFIRQTPVTAVLYLIIVNNYN
jgi:hypothetical protein